MNRDLVAQLSFLPLGHWPLHYDSQRKIHSPSLGRQGYLRNVEAHKFLQSAQLHVYSTCKIRSLNSYTSDKSVSLDPQVYLHTGDKKN